MARADYTADSHLTDPLMSLRKTKATSVDIAHRAGVSQATVSRVLRGSPLVNADTRKRVLDAVQEQMARDEKTAAAVSALGDLLLAGKVARPK